MTFSIHVEVTLKSPTAELLEGKCNTLVIVFFLTIQYYPYVLVFVLYDIIPVCCVFFFQYYKTFYYQLKAANDCIHSASSE